MYPKVIIDDMGKINDIEMTLDNMRKFLPNNVVINSQYDLERIFKEGHEIKEYDKNGHLTTDTTTADLRIVVLSTLKSAREGWSIALSFVKSYNAAEQYGHVSDEAWFGCFVGSEEKLYQKWMARKDERVNHTTTGGSVGTIGAKIAESGLGDQLAELVKRSEASREIGQEVKPAFPKGQDVFLEEVYDLLYMKESWRSATGDLNRLYRYITALATKILHDPNAANYIRYTKNKERILFNIRLLNRYGNYIIISCKNTSAEFVSFQVVNSVRDAIDLGFDVHDLNIPPITFFRNLDEVVFKGNIDDFDIDNTHRLYHIIDERRDRLPKEMQDMVTMDINMRLMASIEMALKIAQTDYKFIVPKYNMEKRSIDFLIPVYSSFDGKSKPECALVVDRNELGKWEIRTVLDIEMAYSNARLINRPDQNWLVIDSEN